MNSDRSTFGGLRKRGLKRNGYALFFALLVVSILLTVALAASRISFQEVSISVLTQDSQIALNATNSGAECAMFWDRREDSVFGSEDSIDCFEDEPSPIDTISEDVYEFVARFGDEQCAVVTVDKSDAEGGETVIESRGYNICPDGEDRNPRRVERAVRIEYLFGIEDVEALMADISIVVDVVGGTSGQTGSGESKFVVLQRTMSKFVDDIEPLVSENGVQLGLTEFRRDARILSTLTTDTDLILSKIDGLSSGQAQNTAGGIFLGTDVINGNPTFLQQNNGQPVDGGRDLDEGKKFIFLILGGGTNQNAEEYGIGRGRQGSSFLSAFEQAADAVEKAKNEGVVVVTFGLGTYPSVDHPRMRSNLASDSDQWERCAEFDEDICYFEVNDVDDLEDVFNINTIFGKGSIYWQPI